MTRTAVRRLPRSLAASIVLVLALAATGCGLKGALTMPSQAEEIVIRPAPGAATEGPTSASPEAGTAPAATPPAEKKVAPAEERLPPPPLPGGNPGTVRGG